MDTLLLLELIGLFFLFLSGSFFSAIETALVASSRARLLILMEQKPKKAKVIKLWLDDPNQLLTTITVGINIVAVGASFLATLMSTRAVEIFDFPKTFTLGLTPIIVAIIVIMFGEIIPKIVAIHNPERVLLLLLTPIYLFDFFISPLTRVLVKISSFFIQIFGGRPKREGPLVTPEEIFSIIAAGEKEGILEKEERKMLFGILKFGETTVKEVMVPRPDLVCAKENLTMKEMFKFFEEAGHSRIPIYRHNLDEIIGLVYAKDLFKAIKEGKKDEPITNLLREVYFVPETKRLDGLLREFQRKRQHLAIVVDEFGGTVGLVTLEDLLEEIVGEIRDEYDTEEPLYRWIDKNTIRVDARISVEELSGILGISIPAEGFETLGGFIFDLAAKVPAEGETIKWKNFEFFIEKMLGRRITRVRLKCPSIKAKPSS
ncbi:MAG: hemolysin family protein [Candidatus Edwardsbacteria bacterium]